MTSTVTLLCPEGIVLGADMRITKIDPHTHQILDYKDGVKKIYRVKKNTQVGISYWGLAEYRNKKILQHLKDFDRLSVKKDDTVDDIANRLKEYLENVTPSIDCRMGLHVAGYKDGVPRLRHVFHWNWHDPGKFTNEDCHIEYHRPNGNKVSYRIRKDYPALFNGDNLIANALFNYAPRIQPYYDIVPHLLSLKDCIDLAKLIISVSTQRLNYYFDQRRFQKIPPTVGGGITIAKITRNQGFKWVRHK